MITLRPRITAGRCPASPARVTLRGQNFPPTAPRLRVRLSGPGRCRPSGFTRPDDAIELCCRGADRANFRSSPASRGRAAPDFVVLQPVTLARCRRPRPAARSTVTLRGEGLSPTRPPPRPTRDDRPPTPRTSAPREIVHRAAPLRGRVITIETEGRQTVTSAPSPSPSRPCSPPSPPAQGAQCRGLTSAGGTSRSPTPICHHQRRRRHHHPDGVTC